MSDVEKTIDKIVVVEPNLKEIVSNELDRLGSGGPWIWYSHIIFYFFKFI